MDLKIEKAIKFQFADPEWKRKSGVLMIIAAIVFGIFFTVVIALYISPFIVVATAKDGAGNTDANIFGIWAIIFGCSGLLSFVSLIIWTAFISGYNLEVTERVMGDPDTHLPELSPVMSKVIVGFKLFLIHILPGFIIAMVYIVFTVVGMGLMFSGAATDGYKSDTYGLFMVIGMLVYMLGICIYFVLLMFHSFFLVPAAYYLFLKRGLSAAFAYGDMLQIIKNNWLDFLIVACLSYAGIMVLSFAAYVPVIGWIFYPAGYVILLNSMAHLYGQVYAKIDGNDYSGLHHGAHKHNLK
jgi:hypothetical protein